MSQGKSWGSFINFHFSSRFVSPTFSLAVDCRSLETMSSRVGSNPAVVPTKMLRERNAERDQKHSWAATKMAWHFGGITCEVFQASEGIRILVVCVEGDSPSDGWLFVAEGISQTSTKQCQIYTSQHASAAIILVEVAGAACYCWKRRQDFTVVKSAQMSRCFSKFQLHSRELVPSVRPWWEFWFCDRKTQQTPLHLALYQTIWSLVLSFMFCSLKTRYLCPWLHLSVSWGPWGPNTLLFVEFLCSCIASMAYKRPNEFSSDSDDSIVSQTRNAWFVTIQVADGPSPARRTHVAMFPKKYSKDSSGRTFRLLTILGFCGVFPVLARESIFVMSAWKTEFVMGAWKTETNNKTCMAYVPTWIVMMMSRIKASSKWITLRYAMRYNSALEKSA